MIRSRGVLPVLVFLGASILATSAQAQNTLWVAQPGIDPPECDCGTTEADPCHTLACAVPQLSAGKTLIVKEGTYNEWLYDTIPSGTSWTAPVKIIANPGDTVTFRATSGAPQVLYFSGSGTQYIQIEGIKLDAASIAADVVKADLGAHHIRLKNCELINATGQGLLLAHAGDGIELLGLNVHNNPTIPVPGDDFHHGIYLNASYALVDGCDIHDNAGWGVHIFDADSNAPNPSGNIVRNNRIHDNATAGARGTGIGIYSGTGNVAYNNIVWGNRRGIVAGIDADGTRIENNTVHGQVARDPSYGCDEGEGIYVDETSDDVEVFNNVVTSNGHDGLYLLNETAIAQHNVIFDNGDACQSGLDCSEPAGGTQCSNNLVADPLYVNPAAHDFHLQSTSPAIDEGLTITEVLSDIDGAPRPMGPAQSYDVGADEFGLYTCATSDYSTSPGVITGGSYADTCASDNIRETFAETLQAGKSRLKHTWLFQNVPAGTHTLLVEGSRPSNSEGDNFQFYRSTVPGSFYIKIQGALINTVGETTIYSATGLTTTQVGSIYIRMEDTNPNGSQLDNVYIDRVILLTAAP